VPRNGEVNRQFGIYKSVCCGGEIVIPADVIFPNCARHADVPTEWRTITDMDRAPNQTQLGPKKKDSSAA